MLGQRIVLDGSTQDVRYTPANACKGVMGVGEGGRGGRQRYYVMLRVE